MEPIQINISVNLTVDKTAAKLVNAVLEALRTPAVDESDPEQTLEQIAAKDEKPAKEAHPEEGDPTSSWGTNEEKVDPKPAPKPSINDEPAEPEGASPFDDVDDSPEKEGPKGPTHEDVLKALQETKTRNVDVKAVRAILAEYKAKVPADLDPKVYAEFIGKLNALKGGK